MLYIDWQTLNDLLKSDVLEVTLEDEGDDHVLRCTLREDMLPPKDKEDARVLDFYTMHVYDLDKKEYSDFALNSIKLVRPGSWD